MIQGGRGAAAVVVALSLWLGSGAAQAQGVTVSESGQALYSLPIAVPPGVGGMEPKLSLVYSSGGINGPVGVGWAVQGISQITRCAKVERVNGKASVRAVRLEAGDSLCLDGQKLIRVTSGPGAYEGTANADQGNAALGATSTEFRTETDGFSRIRASGSAGGSSAYGPASFTVQSKAGLTSVYGQLDTASDAVVRAHRWNATAGAYQDQHATAWLLKRVTDSVGNTLEFSYDNTTRVWGTKGPNDAVAPGREWNLASVKYGCNLNVACSQWHLVNLVYGDRADKAEAYHQGGKVVNTQLLQRVEVRVGASSSGTGSLVRAYRLTHEASARTARSVLKSIAECADAAGTNCLPAHKFSYTGAQGNYIQASGFNLSGTALSSWDGRYTVITGDFNGDGKTDILRTDNQAGQGTGNPNTLWLANALVPGTFDPAPKFSDFSDSSAAPGASVNTLAVTPLAGKVNSAATEDETIETIVTDINGDGRADLIRLCKSTNTTWCPKRVRMWVSLSSSTSSSATDFGLFREIDVPSAGPAEYDTAGASRGWSIGGPLYSAVGLLPVMCFNTIGVRVTDYHTVARDAIWQDMDGDGRVDLVSFEYDPLPVNFCRPDGLEPAPMRTMRYFAGRGDGTFVQKQTPVALTSPHRGTSEKVKSGLTYLEVMDADGDGRPDIVFRNSRWVQDANGQFQFQSVAVDPSPVHVDYRMAVVDINGDGRSDIITVDPDATVVDPSGSGRPVSANPHAARLFVNHGDGTFVPDERPLAKVKTLGERSIGVVVHGQFYLGSGQRGTLSLGSLPLDFSGSGQSDWLAWLGSPDLVRVVILNTVTFERNVRLFKAANITVGDATLPGISATPADHGLPVDLNSGGYSFAGGDFLGLGSAGFLKLGNNGGNSLWHRVGAPADMLEVATGPTGQSTTITYASTAVARSGISINGTVLTPAVYQPTRPALDIPAGTAPLQPAQVPQGTHPIHHAQPASWVVARTAQDAVGSSVITAFIYRGMKVDLSGGGNLGFEAVSKYFPYANGGMLVTTSEYVQDPEQPQYLGLPRCTFTEYNPKWLANEVQRPVDDELERDRRPTRPGQAPLKTAMVQAAKTTITNGLSACFDSDTNLSSGSTRVISMSTFAYGDVQAQSTAGTLDQPAEVPFLVKRPYQQKSTERTWDLNTPDKLVSKVETRNIAMTPFGDVLSSEATTTGYDLPNGTATQAWTKATSHSYELGDNFISGSKWLLGRLKSSSVTAMAPTTAPRVPDNAALSAQQLATQDPALKGTPLRPEQLMVILQLLLED